MDTIKFKPDGEDAEGRTLFRSNRPGYAEKGIYVRYEDHSKEIARLEKFINKLNLQLIAAGEQVPPTPFYEKQQEQERVT